MINGVTSNLSLAKTLGGRASPSPSAAGAAGGSSFADTLKNSIGEVSKLQQDASAAVQDLTTGKNEDVSGVMMAVEKSDLAFKTLLSIRSKLLDAYEEIKNMQV